MASVNLSLTVVAVLFSGFLIVGAVGDVEGGISVGVDVTVTLDICVQSCAEGTYATCSGDVRLPACSCACGPPADGQGCAVYSPDDDLIEQCS